MRRTEGWYETRFYWGPCSCCRAAVHMQTPILNWSVKEKFLENISFLCHPPLCHPPLCSRFPVCSYFSILYNISYKTRSGISNDVFRSVRSSTYWFCEVWSSDIFTNCSSQIPSVAFCKRNSRIYKLTLVSRLRKTFWSFPLVPHLDACAGRHSALDGISGFSLWVHLLNFCRLWRAHSETLLDGKSDSL